MSGSSSARASVIGAGLVGLACAADLAAAGLAVQVLEASDAAGGRMRTDQRAGFLLDRGFQVSRQTADVLRGRLGGPRDLAALGVLSARDMLVPARLIKRGPDRSTMAALAAAGICGELTERFFRPFLAGVFLEDELATSSRFFHLAQHAARHAVPATARHPGRS
jgi:2-polyprenyl-6-methoxyphenol hydroxylase-like FAD-dependent oxidoreductase